MQSERELLTKRLRELLAYVEDSESDVSYLRHILRPWHYGYDLHYQRQILERLSRVEERLGTGSNMRCAFAEGKNSSGPAVVHYTTGIVGREREERKHITNWLLGAQKLTIVDPYFFSFGGPNHIFRTQDQYLESLNDLLPKSLTALDVFHLPGPNRKIFSAFKSACHKRNIALKHWQTSEIHDRVVIRSETEAKALGTSFGGFSNKIAFVLDLPVEDLEVFKTQLHRIKGASKPFHRGGD